MQEIVSLNGTKWARQVLKQYAANHEGMTMTQALDQACELLRAKEESEKDNELSGNQAAVRQAKQTTVEPEEGQ